MTAVACRACGCGDTSYLWHDSDGFRWWRCAICGSDTSEASYDPGRYGDGYVAGLLAGEGRPDPAANHEHNVLLLEKHMLPGVPRTLLDVGTGHGASQDAARARGWEAAGWDVSGEGRPPRTVTGPVFRHDLFARQFGAVLAREVLEHCPDPRGLLRELASACLPGGVAQVTTPRPLASCEWRAYHWAHLCVWSVARLRAEAEAAGLAVVEHEEWELGQRLVARRWRR